jgi:UDP-GlcNAc3NAcA epimerase
MRLVSIVGARPQFVKLAVISRAAAACGRAEHQIIHTGQHYDAAMSDVFFRDLEIPPPDHHLGVGSGSHGEQTGEMLKRLEPILAGIHPDWVILYGDTNSTLAGAVVASKLHFKVAHVEAGLRSFNRRMPEEINRIVADHLSDLLLCPTETSLANLRNEGLAPKAVVTGDVMYDASLWGARKAESTGVFADSPWRDKPFALATIHRAENTDDSKRLAALIEALEQIASGLCPVVLPLHPRTRKVLDQQGWHPRALQLIEPLNYLEMLWMERRARMILTDSGGVQKEAYFMNVPCITLRDETEWVETLANNCNVIAGADTAKIVAAAKNANSAGPWTLAYGDGYAGARTIDALEAHASPE